MKNPVTILSLLISFAISGIAADCDPNAPYSVQPYDGETTKDPAMTKQLIEYWSENTCYKKSDDSEPNMTIQCKNVCFPGADDDKGGAVLSSWTCNFGSSPWSDARTGNPLLCGADKNFAGLMIKTGYCTCNSPIIEILGDFFVEGILEAGKILEKVICPALHALDVVMAIGMAAIPPPGKAITGGMIAAAKSAKTYKYAYEEQDAAQEWADFFLGGLNLAEKAGCGPLIKIPSKDDLIKRAFEPLSNAPDEVVPGGMNYESLPCPKKGCRGCKGPKCKKEDSDDNIGGSKTGSQPNPKTIQSQPEQTHETPKTTQSPTQSSSLTTSVSSSDRPISTLGCKEVAALYTEEEISETKRQTRSYPITLNKHRIEKRKPKEAKACNFLLESFDYPSAGDWGSTAITPKKYGFNTKDSCSNYDWGNPDSDPAVKYESEHVLEWQVVAGFFTQMGEDITDKFDHPNPEKSGKKIGFCDYWLESWNFTALVNKKDQEIDNPLLAMPAAPSPSPGVTSSMRPSLSMQPTPSMGSRPSNGSKDAPGSSSIPVQTPVPIPVGNGSQKRTPFKWLASQYPYSSNGGMWLEEMPLLMKALNAPNKEKIFSRKTKSNGTPHAIRAEKKLEKLAKGDWIEKKKKDPPFDQARVVVQYLREMIGTFIYMQDDEVAKSDDTKEVTFAPWKEQGLGARWNKYMDDVFEEAKKKGTDYMNLHLANLEQAWDSQKKKDEFKANPKDDAKKKDEKRLLERTQKDMMELISLTRKEWVKVKDWKKPKNW